MAAAQAKAASPTPAPSKTSSNQVLLIAKESSLDMELMLTKEVRVMISMLEKAGFKVVVASISGQPITGSATTLKPDLKLADVKIEDYAGFILPCMAGIETFTETIEIVRKAVALGKPVAAQQSSVLTLSKAGVLSGKQFAIYPADEKSIPEGIYKGAGVVQDGNLITSGSSPYAEKYVKSPDTTAELTQKFIDSLKPVR
jgi:putative intracellular protease/amidase